MKLQIPNPKSQIPTIPVAFLVVVLSFPAFRSYASPLPATDTHPSTDTTRIAVAPPPFTPGIFPCSRCHAKLLANPTRRKLVWQHTEIELHHDEENRWCLDCHSADNRDSLHLASGKLIPFTESYKLCGQCHGDKLRAWKAGEHGKRTGSWNGQKQYLLCASCHNPHSPRFKPLAPMPPPVPPGNLRAPQ